MNEPAYPRNEQVWVRYQDTGHKLLFILTSKKDSRDWYFLYELMDGQFKKLGKSRSPVELEEKFHVRERMCKK